MRKDNTGTGKWCTASTLLTLAVFINSLCTYVWYRGLREPVWPVLGIGVCVVLQVALLAYALRKFGW